MDKKCRKAWGSLKYTEERKRQIHYDPTYMLNPSHQKEKNPKNTTKLIDTQNKLLAARGGVGSK